MPWNRGRGERESSRSGGIRIQQRSWKTQSQKKYLCFRHVPDFGNQFAVEKIQHQQQLGIKGKTERERQRWGAKQNVVIVKGLLRQLRKTVYFDRVVVFLSTKKASVFRVFVFSTNALLFGKKTRIFTGNFKAFINPTIRIKVQFRVCVKSKCFLFSPVNGGPKAGFVQRRKTKGVIEQFE